MSPPKKRIGADTKAAIQRVAFTLFAEKGFEATSLREISEQLGISKAALYYHFESKDEILTSLISARVEEVDRLLQWARKETPAPDLLDRAVLKWVDSMSIDKLQGIRFMLSNQKEMMTMRDRSKGIKNGLESVIELLAGEGAAPSRLLLIRMAFMSINSAVMAASGTQLSDEDIVATAKLAAKALLKTLKE